MPNSKTNSSRDVAISNFIWRVLEHVGAKGVGLVVSIILARLLLPSEYGEVAIISVFLNILTIFIDSGFGHALIQKTDADMLDYSSVFYFNIFLCFVLYWIMFLLAPYIATYYRMEHLSPVIRVQSLLLIISGVKSIQMAYVSKHMIFKRFFFATLGGTLGAAVIGIWMAYKGYGVWAIVAQSLFNNTIDTLILWITVKWRPHLEFSFQRIKNLFGFGSRLMLATLIDKCYWEIRQLIIGRMYTSADLAYFNKGGKLPDEISQTISKGMGDILFPMMSAAQEDRKLLKAWVKRSILLHSYIFYPLMFGLAAIAEPLVLLLYTEKWLPMVPYLQVLSMMYVFSSIGTPNTSAVKALGHSDIWLRVNYIRAPIHLIGLVLTIQHSVMAVAIAAVVTTNISALLCGLSSKRLIDYPIWQQIRDILPHLLLSAFMASCMWGLTLLQWPPVATLAVQAILGVAIYVGASVLFKLEMFTYVLHLTRGYFDRLTNKGRS